MSALSDAIHAGTDLDDFNSDDVRAAALHAHDRVIDAIRQQDESAAARRMHSHLHAFRLQAISGNYRPELALTHTTAAAKSSSPDDPTSSKNPANQHSSRSRTGRLQTPDVATKSPKLNAGTPRRRSGGPGRGA